MSLETFMDLPEGELEEWIADYEIEQTTCKTHGGPVSECGDDERDWFPQLIVCHPTMQLEAAKSMYGDLHQERPFHSGDMTQWARTRSPEFPFHWSDGASIFISPTDHGFGGDFLTGDPQITPSPPDDDEEAVT